MRHRFRYTQHFHLSICFRIRIVLCQFLQRSTKKSRLGELGVAYQLENYNAQCSVANKREKVKKKKRRRHTFLSSIHPSIHPLHQWAFQFAFFEFSCNRIPFSLIKHLLAEQKPVAFPAFSVFFSHSSFHLFQWRWRSVVRGPLWMCLKVENVFSRIQNIIVC